MTDQERAMLIRDLGRKAAQDVHEIVRRSLQLVDDQARLPIMLMVGSVFIGLYAGYVEKIMLDRRVVPGQPGDDAVLFAALMIARTFTHRIECLGSERGAAVAIEQVQADMRALASECRVSIDPAFAEAMTGVG